MEKLRWLDLDTNRIDQIMYADLQDPKLRVDKDELGMLISGRATPAYMEWFAYVGCVPNSVPLDCTSPRMFLHEKYVEPLRHGRAIQEWELQDKRRQK